MDTELRQLRRVRWGVRFTLALGISASLAANVLHAHHLLIDQIIAGWPPIAVFATIEAIARVPIHRRWLAIIRMAGLGFVAAIAFWVSYWHMAAVAATHGENGSKYLLPLSVDGLVLVSSISLVELTSQIAATQTTTRATTAATTAPTAATTMATPAPAPVTIAVPAAVPAVAATVVAAPLQTPAPCAGPPASTVAPTVVAGHGGEGPGEDCDSRATNARDLHGNDQPDVRGGALDTDDRVEDLDLDDAQIVDDAADKPGPKLPHPAADPPTGVPVSGSRTGDIPPTNATEAVAYWRAKDPTMSVRDICTKVNRSERTVRRILDALPPADQHPGYNRADPGGRPPGVNGATVTTLADSVTSG